MRSQGQAAPRRDDLLLPFQVEPHGLRGRLVRLGQACDTALTRHGYPDAVAQPLAETMALTGCLAGALKYEGVFTLQLKGGGPIRTLMADVTSEGRLRGYASYDADGLAALDAAGTPSFARLLGGGHMAFTVDQGEHTERYQGIVELTGATLSECAHAYFRQSEQLETGIKIAAAPDSEGRWRAASIMIQRLPYQGGVALPRSVSEDEYEDGWRTAVTLMSSVTDAELLDSSLPPDRLLYRLFHEPGVRAYPVQPLAFGCRCSRSRVERVLRALKPEELEDMKVDGQISVTCEFCKSEWLYDDAALETLRAPDGAAPAF